MLFRSANMNKYYKGGIAFPQQPTAGDTPREQQTEFYSPNWIPPGPVGFYDMGGATDGIAFPQQPEEEIYFSAFPWRPDYGVGGALPGGANEMPCYSCGGGYQEGGFMTPQNMDQYPMMESGGYDGAPNAPELRKIMRGIAKKATGGDTATNQDD